METNIFIFGSLLVLVLINWIETLGIGRDGGLTSVQEGFQIALVWCLPLLGAAITYFFRRLLSEQQTHHTVFDASSNGEGIDLAISEQMNHGGAEHNHES